MMTRFPLQPALLAVLMSAGVAHAGFEDLLKSAGSLLEGAPASLGGGATSSLSDSEIGAGLKEALSVGAERAVALLGRDGGYLNDNSVHIPLPGMLGTAAKALRTAGQGSYVDQFETTMNRAAEQAIPKTLDIVKDTVSKMSLDDVRGILSGGDDAATRFLRENAGNSLREAIMPIVAEATDKAGATAAYKSLKSRTDSMLGGFGSGIGKLGGLIDTKSLDLDSYVTEKTLDGLFVKLAAEEKAIRDDPVARTTEILKTVFGS